MATATQTQCKVALPPWATREGFEENLREARRAVTTVRHAAEDAAAETALEIRQHPLRAVAGAAGIGVVAGVLVGFGAGWVAHANR